IVVRTKKGTSRFRFGWLEVKLVEAGKCPFTGGNEIADNHRHSDNHVLCGVARLVAPRSSNRIHGGDALPKPGAIAPAKSLVTGAYAQHAFISALLKPDEGFVHIDVAAGADACFFAQVVEISVTIRIYEIVKVNRFQSDFDAIGAAGHDRPAL